MTIVKRVNPRSTASPVEGGMNDEDENGQSGDGNSDNLGHDSSDVHPNNNSHDHDSYEGGSGEGTSDNQDYDSSDMQPKNHRRDLQTWDSYQPVPNL